MAKSRTSSGRGQQARQKLKRAIRTSAREQQRLNAELQQRIERLAALHRISLAANDSTLDPRRVLDLVLAEAINLLRADSGVLFHLGENDELHVESAMGDSVERVRALKVPLGKGIVGHVAATGVAELVPDVTRDPRYLLIVAGVHSEITAPLLTQGRRVIGVINIESKQPDAFSQDDLELLAMLASLVARVWDNATLYEALRRRNEELSESYRRLRHAQAKLLQQERLALLGQMAAIVAHEIRNPLTAIRGFVQRIRRSFPEGNRQCRYCQIILEEVDKLNRVTRDITDFAGRPTPELKPTDVSGLLDTVLVMAEQQASEKQINIEKQYDAVPPIPLDERQMQQVFSNIVRNAIQATPPGGRIVVGAEGEDDGLHVFVSDNGPGVSEDVRQHMFDPFFTTRTHGTGLGLALVQKIVESHRGRVEVASEPGRGATFTVILPTQIAQGAPAAGPAATP